MNLNEFRIRKATLKDIHAIMAIENESFSEGIKEDKKTMLERIEVFGDGFLVLVEKEDTPLGYISSEIWCYKETMEKSEFELGHSIIDKHSAEGDELYISSTALTNKLRGSGMGHILFDYLIDSIQLEYPNIKSSVLVVAKEWINAQKIYANKGFIKIGRIDDFFMDSSNKNKEGIIMRKKYPVQLH